VFDHVSLRASDRAATERFYETLLPTLGVDGSHRGEHSTLYGNFELSVAQASEERPVTTGVHIGLRAPSTDAIDAFWQAGVDAGYESDGEPGPRPQWAHGYYGAFLLDPDGNSIEAATHGRLRPRGVIDHLWLRTADFDAARAFQLELAKQSGLDIAADEPDLIRIRASTGGSLTVVAGAQPTTGVHIAIPGSPDRVDAWHAAMVEAGYRSDGAPGPRPYHPSYYGGFVLDPDGRSFELVDHGGLLGERG
jgi:catechol 2,3-dioxygenase-like lactoylglutathione lyase family enzyme